MGDGRGRSFTLLQDLGGRTHAFWSRNDNDDSPNSGDSKPLPVTLRIMSITKRAGTRLRLAAAAAAVVVLAGAALAAAPAQASTTPSTKTWSVTPSAPMLTLAPLSTAAQYEADVVKATNAQRTSRGLPALTVTSCLQSLASKWAAHLAATGTFTHQSLGPFLTDCHANSAGENIAMGNVTAANVVTMWMGSPEHRANLLSSSFRHVAIGATLKNGTWFVVQDFSG
jgi:uncharacterized protein YkwD